MRSKLSALLAVLLSFSASVSAATLTPLGGLTGGYYRSVANGVSADGSTVVGYSGLGAGQQAFRWTSGGGMVGLGDISGGTFESSAKAVSADGSVVVGWGTWGGTSGLDREAFRWTSGGGMVGMGDLPGGLFYSEAPGVSADGSVVVGSSSSALGLYGEAFRWTSGGGMVGLGSGSGATDVSADGSVVVGVRSGRAEAFRWTSGGGMVGLGVLPGGGVDSAAFGVSADGSVVVGWGRSDSGGLGFELQAFRWTSGGGMVGLGDLPGGGFESFANDVSGDGSVVVGWGSASGPEAFRWTSDGGMERLWDVLLAQGVDPAASGWTRLVEARGVSADGNTIVGFGTRNGSQEAFVAVVPEPASIALLALAIPALLRHRRQSRQRQAVGRAGCEVLEGRRLLSFTPAVNYPVDAGPRAVVTGDFNGDGHLDLATANPVAEIRDESGTVSLLLGDGAGRFGAAIDSSLSAYGFNRVSLTAADFDNDGNHDLAFAVHSTETGDVGTAVGILLSNGDGTFASTTWAQAVSYNLAVAAGDFNNDGNSDLVVSGDDGEIYGRAQVLLGNGQGAFASSPYAIAFDGSYEQMAVGDLNGDGLLDAVGVAGEYSGYGAALLGNGGASGGFYNYHEFYTTSDRSADVAVGDFTGDGISDLITVGWTTLDIHVGRGDGMFASPIAQPAYGYWLTGVAVADFNGDGLLDAVTTDANTGTVSELLGNGNGALTHAAAVATGSLPSAIAVGDFNGDGRPDVAAANAGSGTVSVLLNNGTWPVPTPPPPSMRVSDATVTEGNAGTQNAVFTVTLSAPSSQPVTVRYATADGTAAAGADYRASAGTLTFAPGETSKTVAVAVAGDRLPEPDEIFSVGLSDAGNATIADGVGMGTVLDDEPRLAIDSTGVTEGHSGTKAMTFTVTLSAAYDQAVTVNFATRDGTAKAAEDYAARSGSLTFAPGETVKTITISVKGDKKKEANESFYVDLLGASGNTLVGTARGVGTIFNDD